MSTVSSIPSATLSVPVSWRFLHRARHAAQSLAPATGSQPVGWIVPIGRVLPAGLWVHDQLVPWPSRTHARLWRRIQWGCDRTQWDRLIMHNAFWAIVSHPPWSAYVRDLRLLFTKKTPQLNQWADLSQAKTCDIATVRWRPLWRRAQRSTQSGWQHPQAPWLFIPDWPPLQPVWAHCAWDDTTLSLGMQLAHALDAADRHQPQWLDAVPVSLLTALRTTFGVWQAMGLGYFDELTEDVSRETARSI